MDNLKPEIALAFSEICLSCGMCCDGTLFSKAAIRDQAEEAIAHNSGFETFMEDQGDRFFKLPCPHFKGCCSIYDRDRPQICGNYFCKPLIKAQKGKISIDSARKTVEQTLSLRSELLKAASEIEAFKDHTIAELMNEIHPLPTERLKEHRELWIKLIGFTAARAQIAGNRNLQDATDMKKHQ